LILKKNKPYDLLSCAGAVSHPVTADFLSFFSAIKADMQLHMLRQLGRTSRLMSGRLLSTTGEAAAYDRPFRLLTWRAIGSRPKEG
jgi:hypothetical protein